MSGDAMMWNTHERRHNEKEETGEEDVETEETGEEDVETETTHGEKICAEKNTRGRDERGNEEIEKVLKPIRLGVTFSNAVSKAQSSKLEHLFSLKRGKRDVGVLSFELSKTSP